MRFLARRSNISIAIAFFFFIVFYAAHSPSLFLGFRTFRNPVLHVEVARPVRRHVAVASVVGWHFEIYMSIVGILEKELSPSASGGVRVYRPEPFVYGFEKIVNELGLYHGHPSDIETFFSDIDSTALYPEDEGSPMIDLIFLGTCESDLKEWYDRLLKSWDARPADKKFQIVCIFHHGDDIQWHDNLVEWFRRGAIRFLTISEHVGRRLHRNFRALAESNNETINSAGYEYVKMDVYIPVLDLPQKQKHISRVLSNVAIQGSFRFSRREYFGVYADLLASLKEDPRAWGYLPLTKPDSVYEVDETAPLQPFQLHLIGNAGDPEIPPALSNVVRVHSDLPYDDFYSVIQSMDLVLPAFASLEYYDARASSTVAISLECNVPILVNQWMRQAYSFLDDDRVTITRPQAVREIFAVKALRTGQWSPRTAVKHRVNEIMMDVDKMIEKGWIRSADQFATFKDRIWARNTDVVRRILNDI